jgi:pyruvate dehydrogenase E2 component (dihydrolipoamide acetyltransferase)
MAASAAVPQVTLFTTVDVTPTVDLLMAQREADGRAPTFLAAVAHGLCLALRTHPEVNARWEGGTQEIVRIRAVHLGVAVATPRGLLVPVVGDADREDLAGLGRRILDVAQTARGGRSTTADLSGGTITVSNVGVFGVIAGTPLLHDGQAAIVAVGAVARRPCEWRDEVALRSTVTLSLTIDHRVLDGEQGARFLADLGRLLAEPALAFVR